MKKELCLVLLKESVSAPKFIKIAAKISLSINYPLEICGYPNEDNECIDITKVQVERNTLRGKTVSVEDFIINHDLKTLSGNSGSPIVTKNRNGDTVAVGIHTHAGDYGINRGILFTPDLI